MKQYPQTYYPNSEAAMVELGGYLAKTFCETGSLVFLEGDLGAGKTTLVRGILRHFGHEGNVKSPTYTLVEEYQLPIRDIYHFDLYRLTDPEELEYIGIRDYLQPGSLCLIEWPEKGGTVLPVADLKISIKYLSQSREVSIQ